MTTLPSSLFTWTNRRGVTEYSDLAAQGFQPGPTFRIVSARTGKVLQFFRAEPILLSEDDPELVAWVYKTLDGKYQVHILND